MIYYGYGEGIIYIAAKFYEYGEYDTVYRAYSDFYENIASSMQQWIGGNGSGEGY